RQRAAAALRGDEGAHHAARLLPDLGPRRAHVRLDVVGIRELARHPVTLGIAAPDLLEPLEREIDIALAPRREDEVGAIRAHDLLALLAHAGRHDDGAPIALDRGHERARDAGVARRALEHAHAGSQLAARL